MPETTLNWMTGVPTAAGLAVRASSLIQPSSSTSTVPVLSSLAMPSTYTRVFGPSATMAPALPSIWAPPAPVSTISSFCSALPVTPL